MKKLMIIQAAVILLLFSNIVTSCSDDDPTGPSNNTPKVKILMENSLQFGIGSVIRISAEATDQDGEIGQLEFFVDNVSAKLMTEKPFFYDFDTSGLEEGEYLIEAVATDDQEATGSERITVSLISGDMITLYYPEEGKIYPRGTDCEILWADNIPGSVKLELLKEGISEQIITDNTESDGKFDWTIPADITVSEKYSIKITSVDNPDINSISGEFLILDMPFINISEPSENDTVYFDTETEIRWTDNIEKNVKIELFRSDVYEMTISDTTESDGSFMWQVPSDIAESEKYSIRITDIDNNVSAVTEGMFSILQMNLEIVSPNGNEYFNRGGSRNIQWNTNYKGGVVIELLKSGDLHSVLADSIDGTNTFEWKIPVDTPISGDYRVRVTNLNNTGVNDTSDGDFNISEPRVLIYDDGFHITNSEYKVQWYGNSNDSTDLTYYYCVTTDTTLHEEDALNGLESGLWTSTKKNYAEISFPMTAFNSTELFVEDSIFATIDQNFDSVYVEREIVFSKFFVYATDKFGAESIISSKIFGRINRLPDYPKIYSDKLGLNGYNSYWNTIGQDSLQMILPEETVNWKPIDFKWTAGDPDGQNVELEFRWELWERTTYGFTDSVMAESSGNWSTSNLSVKFDNEIYDWNPNGKYAFKVFVRDDALEESLYHSTVNFNVFSPTFEKGILFIDDTNPTLSEHSSYLYFEGNPIATEVRDMYRTLFDNAGYSENNLNPLNDYDFSYYEVEPEYIGIDTTLYITDTDTVFLTDSLFKNVVKPNLKTICEYRMIIIASDDRSNVNGVNYSGSADYKGYAEILQDYLNIGGKVLMTGNSALMKKYPYLLENNIYIEPVRQIFNSDAPDVAEITDETLEIFRDYFGIYSMTFPETKTWFNQYMWDIRPEGVPEDYYLTDNYDFIGAELSNGISDPLLQTLKVDSSKVNDCWVDFYGQLGPNDVLFPFSLKDNGTVLTGIPTIEILKGEEIYTYKSIYDLPADEGDPDTVYDTDTNGTVYHSLKYTDPVTDDGDESGYILHRSGTLATRYASEDGIYKTAFFAFPIYFMDNSENQVSDMFKTMIEWFDLSHDPLAK